jgi:hypothetical protein
MGGGRRQVTETEKRENKGAHTQEGKQVPFDFGE